MTGKLFKGQSLVEILIASGIFLTVVMSLIGLIFGGQSLTTDSAEAFEATQYAREGIEAVRLIRDQDWDSVPAGTYGLALNGTTWDLTPNPDTQDNFTRTITITDDSANIKNVRSIVQWPALPARTLEVSFSTKLTNWVQTQQENEIEGDWSHPITLGTADVDSGVAGTDVQVAGSIVYLATSSTNSSKNDLSIFDVSTPSAPSNLSSVNLAVNGLSAITKSGNYVYAAMSGATDEFMVIDVTNPSAPTKVASHNFSNGRSISVAVQGTILYVGMEQISGEAEFFAIDVSNFATPSVLGSFEVGGNVAAISLFHNRAYLATTVDTAEVMVLDIANPSNITQLGQYDAPGTVDGTSMYVKDEFNVYLGRAGSSGADEFSILNAGDPSSIILKGSRAMSTKVNDMVIVNHFAYIITEEANAELRVLDIADPANIVYFGVLNFPQAATGIAFSNNTLYVSVRSQSALRIIGPTF